MILRNVNVFKSTNGFRKLKQKFSILRLFVLRRLHNIKIEQLGLIITVMTNGFLPSLDTCFLFFGMRNGR